MTAPTVATVGPPENVPLHLQVEVTWKCNWRCVHCYQDDHSVQVLELDELTRLFSEAAGLGTMHVIITGGEPLVRKDIYDVMQAARELGLVITLYTNGHAIDDRAAARLAQLIGVAEISVLAGDEEVHDRLTKVRGSFRRTWLAIERLQSRGVDVVVKTPVLRPAYPTLRALEHRAIGLGLRWNADPEVSPSYAGKDYPLQYRLDAAAMATFYADFPQFSRIAGFNLDPGMKDGMCLAGRNFCFVDALGNVYPCLNFKTGADMHQSADSDTPRMGNVRTSASFADIWGGSAFAQRVRAARRSDFGSCGTCVMGENCSPCMAINYEETGDIFDRAPRLCGMNSAMSDAAHRPGPRLLPLSPRQETVDEGTVVATVFRPVPSALRR